MNDYLIIKNLNNFLLKKKICFFFLLRRDFKKIQNDIDIFIKFKNFAELKTLINRFIKENNYQLVNVVQYEYNSYSFIIKNRSNKKNIFLNLDVCNDYVFNGRTIFALRNCIKEKNINHYGIINLNKKDFFLYYFLKSIAKKKTDENTFSYLRKEFHIIDRRELKNFFGHNNFVRIQKIFNSSYNLKFKNELSYLNLIYINSKPKNYLQEFKRYLNRIFKPSGLSISILGIDGSGKTTIIEGLINQFKYNRKGNDLFRNVSIYHLFNLKSNNSINVTPYQKKNFGIILGLAKIFYLFFMFGFTFIYEILPKKIRGELVIIDRNFQDVLIDPSRYRINNSFFLLNIIFKFLPKPDITIFLNVKPKILYSRKKELNLKKIYFLFKKFNLFYKNNNYINKIQNNKKKENALKKITNLIIKKKIYEHK